MALTKKQIKELVLYWKEGGLHDYDTAKSLWKSKRYDACLFFCHLSLEKLLKGVVVEVTQESAPYTHDLVLLVQKANIVADKNLLTNIAIYTNFNMSARYPEDKLAFYKICTREFSEPYFKESQKLVLWLKQFYQKEK